MHMPKKGKVPEILTFRNREEGSQKVTEELKVIETSPSGT